MLTRQQGHVTTHACRHAMTEQHETTYSRQTGTGAGLLLVDVGH